jgi:hypothetical protein
VQGLDHAASVHARVQLHHVQVMRRARRVAPRQGLDARVPGKGGVVAGRQGAPPLHEVRKPAQLAAPQGAVQVAGPVVHAQALHLAVPGARVGLLQALRVADQAVVAEAQQALAQLRVVGGHRATLTHGHVLGRMEREHGHV